MTITAMRGAAVLLGVLAAGCAPVVLPPDPAWEAALREAREAAAAPPPAPAPAPRGRQAGRAAPAPTPAERVRTAFRTGDARGLAGCWVAVGRGQTGMVIVREEREICVSPAGEPTLRLDRRAPPEFTREEWRHTGVSFTCPAWPGFRVAEASGGAITFDAPAAGAAACVAQRRLALDLDVRVQGLRLFCLAAPKGDDGLLCEETRADGARPAIFAFTRR